MTMQWWLMRGGNLESSGCSASETGASGGYNDGKHLRKLIASPNVNAPSDNTTKPMICKGMKGSQPNTRDSIPAPRVRPVTEYYLLIICLYHVMQGRGPSQRIACSRRQCSFRTNEDGAEGVGDNAVARGQHFRHFDAEEIKKTD